MDLLGPDIFSTLWMKGQVLHREEAILKVLMTKKWRKHFVIIFYGKLEIAEPSVIEEKL